MNNKQPQPVPVHIIPQANQQPPPIPVDIINPVQPQKLPPNRSSGNRYIKFGIIIFLAVVVIIGMSISSEDNNKSHKTTKADRERKEQLEQEDKDQQFLNQQIRFRSVRNLLKYKILDEIKFDNNKVTLFLDFDSWIDIPARSQEAYLSNIRYFYAIRNDNEDTYIDLSDSTTKISFATYNEENGYRYNYAYSNKRK